MTRDREKLDILAIRARIQNSTASGSDPKELRVLGVQLCSEVDRLKRELESSEQRSREYKDEWENACERYSYANECIDDLKSELSAANGRDGKYRAVVEACPSIVCDPAIRYGAATLIGTRLDVDHLLGCLAAGESVAAIEADHEIPGRLSQVLKELGEYFAALSALDSDDTNKDKT